MRLAPEIRDVADKYVRLRLSNMRGLDLHTFDFDYDLTWAALLLSSEGQILGRFGGRDATSPDAYRTLPALRYALEQGLIANADRTKPKGRETKPALRPEDYSAAKSLSPRSCIHCHHVHEFQRAEAMSNAKWSARSEYRYPDPKTLNLTLAPKQGNRIATASAPLAKDDILLNVNGLPVRSYADIAAALDRAAEDRPILLKVQRGKGTLALELRPAPRWKEKTDISWRWSLKSLAPEPPVSGEDLSDTDRLAMNIAPGSLAIRQGPFLRPEARQAGVQIGDVIVGIEGIHPSMTARQFDVFFRLHLRDRKEVILNIRRGTQRLQIPIKMP